MWRECVISRTTVHSLEYHYMAFPAPKGVNAANFPGKFKDWNDNEILVATAAYETLTDEHKTFSKTKQAELVYAQLCEWYPNWTRPATSLKIDFLAKNAANRSLGQQLADEKDEKDELQKKLQKELATARACVGYVKKKNKNLEDENKKLEDITRKAAGMRIR